MSTSTYSPDDPILEFIQSRAEVDLDLVEEYAGMMADGVGFDPCDAITDGSRVYIWDGFHRGEAAKKSGTLLLVRQRPGTHEEAQWLALAANQKHGLKRSNADKQKIVRLALLHPAGAKLSDRQIAQHCGVNDKTVGKIRAEMESTAEIPQLETRIGADGRERHQPTYLSIWQLETKVKDWLGEKKTDQIAFLEEIKAKTSDGKEVFKTLCNSITEPYRSGELMQACNNVLHQLKMQQWRAERAERIRTMVCICGEQTLEPISDHDAIRCTACGQEWNSIASFTIAQETAPQPGEAEMMIPPDLDTAPRTPAAPDPAEISKQLYRALHSMQDAEERWNERRMHGMSDTALMEAIRYEFGIEGGSSGPGDNGHRRKGGADPRFWLGHSYGDRPPTLRGKALVAATRELLKVPYPINGKEPEPTPDTAADEFRRALTDTLAGELLKSNLNAWFAFIYLMESEQGRQAFLDQSEAERCRLAAEFAVSLIPGHDHGTVYHNAGLWLGRFGLLASMPAAEKEPA